MTTRRQKKERDEFNQRAGCVVMLVLICGGLTALAFVAFLGSIIGQEVTGLALGGLFIAFLASLVVAIVVAAAAPPKENHER